MKFVVLEWFLPVIRAIFYAHISFGAVIVVDRCLNFTGRSDTGRQFFKEVPLMRVKVTLRCSECKQRNYNTMKNKKNDPDRLEMKKYCRFCRKHTTHNETK